MDPSSLLGILAVFALVAANGFFVAAEFALVRVRVTRIEQLVAEGRSVAQVVRHQIHHLDNYLASTQLGITLASLALGWIGEPSLAHLLEPLFAWVGGVAAMTLAHSAAVTISFLLITTLHIILGELVPKSIALQRTEGTVFVVARPLFLFTKLLRPFILFMNGAGNAVVRLLGLQATGEQGLVHTVEELEMLVAQSRQSGILDTEEERMLYHVFGFGEKKVADILLPRSEMVAIPSTITLSELQRTFARESYTRLPVYEETWDNVIGLVHLKDVFSWLQRGAAPETFSLRQMVRPVLEVTERTAIEVVFAQMRKRRIHLAMVFDEYGTMVGMVTLEDVVEEIVGEVQDEFDTREQGVRSEVEPLPDGSASVDGLMNLAAFCESFGLKQPTASSHTLGGYVTEHLGRLAQVNDAVELDTALLLVEELDGRRVARVHVEM
jgi:putative hemolysin